MNNIKKCIQCFNCTEFWCMYSVSYREKYSVYCTEYCVYTVGSRFTMGVMFLNIWL